MSNLIKVRSIRIDNPITVESKNGGLINTNKLERGQHVRIAHATILDASEEKPANYSISDCFSDIFSSDFEIHLIGSDGAEYNIKFKPS